MTTRIVAVDLDGTLIFQDEEGVVHPVEGGREALEGFRRQGYRVVIYTCRTGLADAEGTLSRELAWIESTLERFKIPYDSIYLGNKLVADVYIDDRAVSFRGDWQGVVNLVTKDVEMLPEG